MHKIVTPHMIDVLGAVADTRAIIEPDTSPFLLSRGNLQAFRPPDALHALVIHPPTVTPKQFCHPTIPIAPINRSQLDDTPGQPILIATQYGLSSLSGPRLSKHPAKTSLRDFGKGMAHMLDRFPSLCRA